MISTSTACGKGFASLAFFFDLGLVGASHAGSPAEGVGSSFLAGCGGSSGRGTYVKIKSLGGVNVVKLNKL